MIKFLRQGAIDNPWVFRGIMLVIAITFVITMGWWGFGDDEASTVVAQIGDRSITSDEYERAYRNAERFYRDLFKDQFNADLLKQLDLKHQVINTLVERELWLKTARRMNVTLSSQELADSVAAIKAFQREDTARFDPELYRRVLKSNHMTPETFETNQRDELLIAKVKSLVSDSTAVSAPEWDDARARQAAQNPGPTSDATLPSPLPQKQERTLHAYMDSLRRNADVVIEEQKL
jgi:peptidyl-prolyl cis-trans isomerase D